MKNRYVFLIHYVDRRFDPPKCLKIRRLKTTEQLEIMQLEDDRIVSITQIS